MFSLKKPAEIEKMRKAGKVVADVLCRMREIIRPGVNTMTLEVAADQILDKASAKAAFKGYKVPGLRTPFPSSVCVSINDEVVHGIPSKDVILNEGDIVSVDFGAVVEGYYGDAACSYPVGDIDNKRAELLDITKRSLYIGIEQVRPGNTIGDIGHAIERFVVDQRSHGLVRDYTGHGIGKHLHESPQVPNFGKSGSGMVMKSGMTFCIEPMVMNGAEAVKSAKDGWTVLTKDGSDAAHFEHTLLVTENGYEILTPWE